MSADNTWEESINRDDRYEYVWSTLSYENSKEGRDMCFIYGGEAKKGERVLGTRRERTEKSVIESSKGRKLLICVELGDEVKLGAPWVIYGGNKGKEEIKDGGNPIYEYENK